MRAKSVLLEPYYSFTLAVPAEQAGRAINDIRMMYGSFSQPEAGNGETIIRGSAPVSKMRNYMNDVAAYTRGRGRLTCVPCGYDLCRDADAVISSIAYDPLADVENTPDSVFCAHGAGFNVRWDKVPEYMHLESCIRPDIEDKTPKINAGNLNIDEKELESIMLREFGPIKRPVYSPVKFSEIDDPAPRKIPDRYLIIDGYNVIFGWDELKSLAGADLASARLKLMDILADYRSFSPCEIVLVFDGYRVKSNPGEKFDYHGLHVVYTKEGQTGDMFIERLANEIGKNYSVAVVTSDNLIRLSALRSGILRKSVNEFHADVQQTSLKIAEIIARNNALNEKSRFSLDIPDSYF